MKECLRREVGWYFRPITFIGFWIVGAERGWRRVKVFGTKILRIALGMRILD